MCAVSYYGDFTKHCGPVGSNVLSYLVVSGFKDWFGDRIPWLGFFEVTVKVVHQIRP